MPPQQGKRLLDLADGPFGLCAHLFCSKPIARLDIGAAKVEVKDNARPSCRRNERHSPVQGQ